MKFQGSQLWPRIVCAFIFVAALPFACAAALRMFDPALGPDSDPFLVWANVLPVGLAILLLWTLLGRAVLASWIGLWLLWTLFAINAAKFENLQRMLSPSDWALLGQVLGNPRLFWAYVDLGLAGLLAAVGVVGVSVLLWRVEPRTLPRLPWRVPMVAVSWLLLASVLAGAGPWRDRIDDQHLAGFQIWSPDYSIQRSGLAIGLVRLGWEGDLEITPPDDSEHEALEHFRDEVADRLEAMAARVPPQPMPDVIVVQSEALFDPGILRGFNSGDWLPGLRRLAQRGHAGQMQVPVFGGGTIRTEFEVLTGYPMATFPSVQYPYFGLTDRPLPSLASLFGEHGYRTLLVHPYERSFWNRDHAVRMLGFDESQFDGDPAFRNPQRHGPYISDRQAYDATLAMLSEDRPQFVFLITMENHSPWTKRSNIDDTERDAIAFDADLDPAGRRALQTYLLHLEHGDEALEHFANAVLDRQRPTLLLVFGDHLPGLKREFAAIGFDDGRAPWEQAVPWVLAANFEIEEPIEISASHQIPAALLHAAGMPLRGHLAASRLLAERASRATTTEEADRWRALNRVSALSEYLAH